METKTSITKDYNWPVAWNSVWPESSTNPRRGVDIAYNYYATMETNWYNETNITKDYIDQLLETQSDLEVQQTQEEG